MQHIPPVSGELAKLWDFLGFFFDFYDSEIEDTLKNLFWLSRLREETDRLEEFLLSKPEPYVVRYTVETVMNRGIEGQEQQFLEYFLKICKKVLREREEEEK